METRPDLYDDTADPEVWSNHSHGGKRLTWRELAEQQHATIARLSLESNLLRDLDRCEHGRHEGDPCFGCEGPSEGNPFRSDVAAQGPLVNRLLGGQLVPIPDRTIGFDLSGTPIVIPHRGDWVAR